MGLNVDVNQQTNFLANIERTSAAPVLNRECTGIVFVYTGSANINVAVPNNLPEGFNCGFVMYGTGTITLTGAATNRSAKTALTTQYSSGSIMVTQNLTGTAAEYLAGGDFA